MAGNEIEKEQDFFPIDVKNTFESVDEEVCVPVTLSCGIQTEACGETTPEILAEVQALEKKHCPFAPL